MKKRWVLQAAAGAAMLAPHVARGGDVTWDNGDAGNNNWGSGANWLGVPDNTVPSPGDNVFFGTAGGAATMNSGISRTVGSVVFNRDADFTINGTTGALLTINTGISAASPTATGRKYVISAPIALGGNNIWDVGSNTTLSLSGTISGTQGFTKIGDGIVELMVTNNFDGDVVLNAGTVQINDIRNPGQSSPIGRNSTITLNGGALRYVGGGHTPTRVLTLGVNGGILDASGTGILDFSNPSAMNLSGSGARTLTLTGTSTGNNALAAAINDSGGSTSLVKSGPGTWVLSGNSGLSGDVHILGGTLLLNRSTGALASAQKFTVEFGSTLRLDNTGSGNVQDNRIGDTAEITLLGSTLNYSGIGHTNAGNRSDETIGRILIRNGASTLSLAGSTGASGADAAGMTISLSSGLARDPGTTLRFFTDDRAYVHVNSHAEVNNIVGGWMLWDDDDFASLNDANKGNIVLASSTTNFDSALTTDNVRISSDVTVGSAKTINSLVLHSNNTRTINIDTNQFLVVDSGGIILNGGNGSSTKTIAAAGTGTLSAGAGGGYELIVHATTGNTNNAAHVISAPIVNNGDNAVSFTKGGVHALSLRGDNTYTGNTYVAQGTLFLQSSTLSNTIGSSSKIIVHNGATLNVSSITLAGNFKLGANQTLGGNGSVVGAVTADAAGSMIAPGTSAGILTFSGSGNITLNTNATVEIELGGDGNGVGTAGVHYDQIAVSGGSKVFTPGSATLKLVTLPGVVYGQAYTIVSATGGASIASSFFKTLDNVLMNNEAMTYTQGGMKFNIDYVGTSSITVTLVPEPGSIGLLALGGAALLRRRRRA